MKDVRVFELNEFEFGIVINALNEFRNMLIKEERNTELVDEILLKILDSPHKKRMFPRQYVEER